jgi:hypothetical protein
MTRLTATALRNTPAPAGPARWTISVLSLSPEALVTEGLVILDEVEVLRYVGREAQR